MNRTQYNAAAEKTLVDIEGLKSMLSLGRASAEKIAAESNAIIRVGRRKLYKVDRIKTYLEHQTTI